jgi:hypothetical protein
MPHRYASLLNAQFLNHLLAFPLEMPAYDTYVYWQQCRRRFCQRLVATGVDGVPLQPSSPKES